MLSKSLIKSAKAVESSWLLLAQIVLSSLLIALCAQIRIPLPFTPVPITMQTFAVMLLGGILGSRNAVLSVTLYLAEVTFGLPFLNGFQSNPLALMGVHGGYLIGFLFQAYIVGWFVERQAILGKNALTIGLALACAVQLTCGAIGLTCFFGVTQAFLLGVVPFICGELFKSLAVAPFLKRFHA